MTTHIINRYEFNTICAGILRLTEKPELYQKYKAFIEPAFFFYSDTSLNAKALRKLVTALQEMDDQNKAHDMSIESFQSFMHYSLIEGEVNDAAKALFTKMRTDDDIKKRAVDPACFKQFLDYLKVLRMAKHATPMFQEYQNGKIDEAAKHMTTALAEINQIQDPTVLTFEVEKNYDDIMIGTNLGYIQDLLPSGCAEIDSVLGGGFETQTLNGFISVPNGGKSTMAHHLLVQCFKHKKYVHITCVEDRPKSFLCKLTAALTGIPVWRLRKEFNNLTSMEKAQISDAKKIMQEYMKVEFVYGQSVETIQKSKLDYDLACKTKGRPAPVVDIIDYTGHIAGRSAGDKMYEKMRVAYGARKDFALANNKIAFDFAQVNRDGTRRMNTDEILTMSDLAGSFDISQIFDNIISINRSMIDRSENKAILHICKSRDGEAGGQFKVRTDFSTARWHMDECEWMNAPADFVRSLQGTLASNG